jgi:hypothetical protein
MLVYVELALVVAYIAWVARLTLTATKTDTRDEVRKSCEELRKAFEDLH